MNDQKQVGGAYGIWKWLLLFLFFIFRINLFAQPFDCEEELFSKKDKKTRLFGYVNMLGEYRIPPSFLRALPFSGKYAVVQQGKKFGVINCEGVLVVPADYDEISAFINGKGWVKQNGKWGLADIKGRILIQPQYDDVQEINTFNGTVTWVKKNEQWGLISRENGRMLVNPQYEAVSNISDSAGIGRKSGFQDLVYYGDGRIIISKMRQVKKAGSKLFIYQHENRKFGVFNTLAFITLRPNWDTIFLNSTVFQVKNEGKFGLLNLRGNEILAPEYSSISPAEGGFLGVTKDGNFAVMDMNGKVQSPETTLENGTILPTHMAILKKGENAGIWDLKKKKWAIPFENQEIKESKNKKWVQWRQNGKARWWQSPENISLENWDSLHRDDEGAIRVYRSGKVALAQLPEGKVSGWFDAIEKINDAFFRTKSGNNVGIFSTKGSNVLPNEYQDIKAFVSPNGQTCFTILKNEKWGLADAQGKVEILPDFDQIIPAMNGITIIKTGNKWAIRGARGQWLGEARWDSITTPRKQGDWVEFPVLGWKKGKNQLISEKGEELSEPRKAVWKYLQENVFAFQDEQGWHLYSSQGKMLGNLNFNALENFSEGNAPACQNNKWGFVNAFGRMVIQAQYDAVLPYQNGIAFAQSDGKWGVLRKNGSWLVKPVGIRVGLDEDGKRKLILP